MVLRLRDCLETAVPLLLEATAQCGSLCHAHAWRNTRVCCSGPRPGLVTVATTGLRLTLLPPLNLSVRGPTSRTRLVTTATPSLPGVAPGRAGRGPGWRGTAQPCPSTASAPGAGGAQPWHGCGCSWGTGAQHTAWAAGERPSTRGCHAAVTVAPAPGLVGWWAVLSHQECVCTGLLGEVPAGAHHMRRWTLTSCESRALSSSL